MAAHMKDQAHKHPKFLFAADFTADKLPKADCFDPLLDHKLLLARAVLGARDRGKAGSEHVYINSAGELTSAEQSK